MPFHLITKSMRMRLELTMKRKWISAALAVLLLLGILPEGISEDFEYEPPEEFRFVDTRFRGVYTTENLDAILEAYELNDGWYWVTKPDVTQNYHAHENKKGWTQSSQLLAEEKNEDYFYNRGWFGCRWECNEVESGKPNAYGWGECFGFCQFLGYLLSGEVNPHGKWRQYNSVWEADGLRVGDIIRVEYTDEKGFHQHSAMVYSIKNDRVRFIQCSGVSHNKLYINWGFRGANLGNTTLLSDIRKFPGLRIHRAIDRNEMFEQEWTEEPDAIRLNLVDLDDGMVAFLDPTDMRVWDVYDNWRQWSKNATEVDLSEFQQETEDEQQKVEVQTMRVSDLDNDVTPVPGKATPAPTSTPTPTATPPPSEAPPVPTESPVPSRPSKQPAKYEQLLPL